MKVNDCSIVQDLLPLYIEDMLRPDTTAFVEDHLSGCSVCTAALGDLKAETTAPIPAPDTAEARQSDKRVLKGLRKKLTQQNIPLTLALIYAILHFFPWVVSNGKGIGAGFPYLILTIPPLYLATALAFRSEGLRRNVALTVTPFILPVCGLTAFSFIGYLRSLIYKGWRPMPFYPAYILAMICGLALTILSLRSIWTKLSSPQPPRAMPARVLGILALVLSGLILALHIFPWDTFYNYGSEGHFPLDFYNLFITWLPLYITTAIAFCTISNYKHALFATVLAMAMPVYVSFSFLSHWDMSFAILGWQRPEWFYPFYNSLLLGLSCLLSAIAICGVWYQLIHQTKAQQKCRLEESHETK